MTDGEDLRETFVWSIHLDWVLSMAVKTAICMYTLTQIVS